MMLYANLTSTRVLHYDTEGPDPSFRVSVVPGAPGRPGRSHRGRNVLMAAAVMAYDCPRGASSWACVR